MEPVKWFIPKSRARKYREQHGQMIKKWRDSGLSNRCKPKGITLDAWLLLTGSTEGHIVKVTRDSL